VRWSKSANPIGKTAEALSLSDVPAPNSCIDTLSRAAYTEFSIGSRGSGEGRANRPRSRHCDRLEAAVSQATLPWRRGPRSSRERAKPEAPGRLAGLSSFLGKVSPESW
jgi:hypothetical protein